MPRLGDVRPRRRMVPGGGVMACGSRMRCAAGRRGGKFSGDVKQQDAGSRVCMDVEPDDGGVVSAARLPGPAGLSCGAGDSAGAAVGALYQASALGLIRLAYVMLGDRPSAEDVVQEAFCGLYRQWGRLDGADGAMYYVRASVLNGCRSVLRHRAVRRRGLAEQPP